MYVTHTVSGVDLVKTTNESSPSICSPIGICSTAAIIEGVVLKIERLCRSKRVGLRPRVVAVISHPLPRAMAYVRQNATVQIVMVGHSEHVVDDRKSAVRNNPRAPPRRHGHIVHSQIRASA